MAVKSVQDYRCRSGRIGRSQQVAMSLVLCEKKWASFKGNGVSWGSVVHWSTGGAR